ncbi:SDR family NAD(P)-dependent oxidoreductase [Sphingomonas sp. Leaf343]|uniref:SDR family NAD(P)-dependent oxidoreductase n=1 Tax=Sphingomonas sp. Leaf343 TaxID=1736345 RepID=UPI0006F95540|nr:SDR family oxidoreductase [Sphingomonas sp. Leaf343]KQR82400.1 AraC family transcriptional regulator [Sphingomonas sp. Leaf343]
MTTALITGASSGIGTVYARRLAARGHDLVLVARDAARLEALAAELRQAHDVGVEVLVVDLTDATAFETVYARLGEGAPVDILVNNAGMAVLGGFGADRTKVASMLNLNMLAPTFLAHAVLPGMVARGGGAIVNIASVLALLPEYGPGAYAATKSYLMTLSQSLHAEYAGNGIYIQAVLPAATRTEIYDRAGGDISGVPGVMEVDHLVDAALIGFDRKELVTIPPVPDVAAWDAFEQARGALAAGFTNAEPAARYRT